MGERRVRVIVLGITVCLTVSAVAVADFYDNFTDGWWERDSNDPSYDANDPNWTDPNNAVMWDKDNPDWDIKLMIPGAPAFVQIMSDSVADNAFRIWADRHFFLPQGGCGAYVDTGAVDPNISPAWWDDTTDHYVLSWVYYTGYYDPETAGHSGYNDPNYDPNDDDPNDDKGILLAAMHLDDANWTGMSIMFRFAKWYHPTYPWMPPHHTSIYSLDGASEPSVFRDLWIDPDHPDWGNYPTLTDPNALLLKPGGCAAYTGSDFGGENLNHWERSGFWMLIQFEQDPNYATGDPNGKFLRGAIWHGDKYGWDGKWLFGGELSGDWDKPETVKKYWPEGWMAFAVSSDVDRGNGFPGDAAVDQVEARSGQFTATPHLLDLTISNGHMGRIDIDPDLPDPNDPNTSSARLCRYTDGTQVVLVAKPLQGKSLKQWIIYDPNHPGDANHVVIDTNSVLYLTMDADWEIEAAFKCGGSVPPFVAMTLLALATGVVVRRFRVA